MSAWMDTFSEEEHKEKPIYVLWRKVQGGAALTLTPRPRATSVSVCNIERKEWKNILSKLRDDDVFDSLLGPVDKELIQTTVTQDHPLLTGVMGAFAVNGPDTNAYLVGAVVAMKITSDKLRHKIRLSCIFLAKTFRQTPSVLEEMLQQVPGWIASGQMADQTKVSAREPETVVTNIDGITVSLDAQTLKADYNPIMAVLHKMNFRFWGVQQQKVPVPNAFPIVQIFSKFWTTKIETPIEEEWSENKVSSTTMEMNKVLEAAEQAKLTLRQTVWVEGILPHLQGDAIIAYVMVKDKEAVNSEAH